MRASTFGKCCSVTRPLDISIRSRIAETMRSSHQDPPSAPMRWLIVGMSTRKVWFPFPLRMVGGSITPVKA